MASRNAKAAQHGDASGFRKLDQLGGVIYSEDTKAPQALQVSRLTRRFIISPPLASVVAGLAYGEISR